MTAATPLFLFLLIVAVACFALAVSLALSTQAGRGSDSLAMQFVGIGVWTAAYGLTFLDVTTETQQHIRDVGALGVLIAPAALTWFIAGYTGRDVWLNRTAATGLALTTAAFGALFVTNYRGLVNPSILPGHDIGTREFGPVYFAGILWVAVLLTLSGVLVLRHRRRATAQQRSVATVLLLTTVMPWLASFLRLRHVEILQLDPVLFGIMIAALGCGHAYSRGLTPDLERIARNTFVRHMSDGVVVLDDEGSVVVLSQRTSSLLGVDPKTALGKQWFTLPADARAWHDCLAGSTRSAEIRDADGSLRHVRAERTDLTDHAGRPMGTAILLRDISDLHTDALTGIGNRRCLYESAPDLIDSAVQQGRVASVLALDLDRLKFVNDTSGHLAGDNALIESAQAMRAVLRANDRLVRMSGDEFAAVLVTADATEALAIAERLRARVESLNLGVTVTGGMTTVSSGEDLIRALIRADEALYDGKASGRNRINTRTDVR